MRYNVSSYTRPSEVKMIEMTAILLLGGTIYLQSRKPKKLRIPVRKKTRKNNNR